MGALETRWTARTENSLAQVLCRLAEGGEVPGVCGAHIGEAIVVLTHLADIGALNNGGRPACLRCNSSEVDYNSHNPATATVFWCRNCRRTWSIS